MRQLLITFTLQHASQARERRSSASHSSASCRSRLPGARAPLLIIHRGALCCRASHASVTGSARKQASARRQMRLVFRRAPTPPGTIFRSGSTAHSILCELRALTVAFLLPVIQMTVPGYVATGDVRTASLTVVDQNHTHRSRAYRCVCAGRAVLMIFSYVMWKHNLVVRIGGGHVHHRLHRARCHRYV